MPASLHRHFERMREIFFVPFSHDPFAKPFRGSTASVLPRYGVSRSLLSNTLRLTANEKDPSTALGMTKRGKTSSHFFSSRYESQPPPPSGHLLPEEGGSMPPHRLPMKKAYDTRIPLPHIRHFERTREIFFVCGEAKAARGAVNGKHRASCDWGGRCFMQELYEGKRKRETKKIPRLRSG